jgi:hypothetical protein
LYGFAFALTVSFVSQVKAVVPVEGTVDCSVVSTDACSTVILPGGSTNTTYGKAKAVKAE